MGPKEHALQGHRGYEGFDRKGWCLQRLEEGRSSEPGAPPSIGQSGKDHSRGQPGTAGWGTGSQQIWAVVRAVLLWGGWGQGWSPEHVSLSTSVCAERRRTVWSASPCSCWVLSCGSGSCWESLPVEEPCILNGDPGRPPSSAARMQRLESWLSLWGAGQGAWLGGHIRMCGLNLWCAGRAEAKEACFCELGRDGGSWAECRMVGRGPSDVPKVMLAGQHPRENRASDRGVLGVWRTLGLHTL